MGRASSPLAVTRFMRRAVGLTTALLVASCSGSGGTTEDGGVNLLLSVGTLRIQQGHIAQAQGLVTRTGSYDGSVTTTVEGAPAGVTVSVGGGTSNTPVVYVVVAASAAPGTYPLVVRTRGSGISDATASLNITVDPAGSVAYTIAVADPVLTMPVASTATTTVTVTRVDVSGAIALRVGGLTPNLSGALTPLGNDRYTLNVSVSAALRPGTYYFTVGGTSPGLPDVDELVTVIVTP